jgi:hypothetical protein
MDAVLSAVYTRQLRAEFGNIDSIHALRASPAQSDLELMMLTTHRVIITCWSEARLNSVLPAYLSTRGWAPCQVRAYMVGLRLPEVR